MYLDTTSTLTSLRQMQAMSRRQQQDFLRAINKDAWGNLRSQWPFWAREAQLPPKGDWHSWLFLGGRGAGKTRAGAEWIASLMTKTSRIALIGPTLHDVREVMIEGPSGLRTIADARNRPTYETSRRRLIWPQGGVAYAFSAEDPESLRGPQFHAAWADEFCTWRNASETLALLRMGLRLGPQPRLCVTTTPKPTQALRALMAEAKTVQTRSSTVENHANLSAGFLESVNSLYGGTRMAAQELLGMVVEDEQACLWRAKDLEACYGAGVAPYDEIILAIDPPVMSHGDACGMIVAGRKGEKAYVLDDCSVNGASPLGWAKAAVMAATKYGVRRIVAEANQGGEMVRSMLNISGASMSVKLVHARLGKRARAEPVAALYEQGRVIHAPARYGDRFGLLDEELMAIGSYERGSQSPDRADALVWAITELLLTRCDLPRLTRL